VQSINENLIAHQRNTVFGGDNEVMKYAPKIGISVMRDEIFVSCVDDCSQLNMCAYSIMNSRQSYLGNMISVPSHDGEKINTPLLKTGITVVQCASCSCSSMTTRNENCIMNMQVIDNELSRDIRLIVCVTACMHINRLGRITSNITFINCACANGPI
jgi:hypothetical protein